MSREPQDDSIRTDGFRGRSVLSAAIVGALAGGALDAILLVLVYDRARVASALTIVGLWVAATALAAPAIWGLGRVVPMRPIAAGVRAGWRAVLDGGGPDSVPSSARMLGVCAGAVVWLGAGFVALAQLIEHRNGPGLIAGTFLIVNLMLLMPAYVIGAAVRRGVIRLGRPTLRTAAIGVAVGAVVFVIATRVALFELVPKIDARPLAPVLAFAVAAIMARNAPRRRWLLIVPALGLAVFVAGARIADVRHALARRAPATSVFFVRLLRYSDFDRDGTPSLPDFRDCAPFDPTIRPFAPDPAGDGIDQDCDGHDGGPVAAPLTPMPGKRPDNRPNIVLITVDSLRADHLSLYGYHRPTSPRLDARAGDAVIFERAWTADAGTGPSLWSLMAGKAPFEASIEVGERWPPTIAATESPLAERLDAVGYRTEAIMCGQVFRKKHWTIRRGFDGFVELCKKDRKGLAERITKGAMARIDMRVERAFRNPYFLWVHYYDPHKPYADFDHIDFADPDADRMTQRIGRYDEEIRYTDTHLDGLLEGIGKLPGETWVFITADHGENFGTHGTAPHARNLYREVTHVPFIVFGPGAVPRRITAPVAMIDIYPTVLELAGIDPGPSATRRSVLSVIQGGEPDPERLIYQENSFARPLRHTRAVVGQRYHLITDLTVGYTELYDLETDPDEQRDLGGTGHPAQARLEAALARFITLSRLPPAYAR